MKMQKLKTGSLMALVALGITWAMSLSRNVTYADSTPQKIWTEKSEAEKAGSGAKVDAAALNRVFVDLAKNLSPAVVNIYTKTRIAPRMDPFGGGGFGGRGGQGGPDDLFRFFFGNPFGGGGGGPSYPQEAQALGSGFVINADGLIITNSHVVRNQGKNADSVMIKFLHDSASGKGSEAKILGVDESTDVAVLKLKSTRKDLVVAPLGASEKVQVGEWVIAIGNPYGHTNSVTKGIVSALGRNLESSRADFIQTDASINPGNSGGPLFNLYGEVIGINTAIDARAQGIGFAIPVSTVKNVVRQIIEKGEVTLGWIGVAISEISPQIAKSLGMAEPNGVLIQDVFPGEPADKAGLKAYDVVVGVNGKEIGSTRDFMISVGNLPVGTKTAVKILRDGKPLEVSVTVGKRKSEAELAKKFSKGSGGSGESGKSAQKTGLLLGEVSPEVRRQLELDPVVKGAVIQRVLNGSPGAAAGLAPGDVITEINRKPIHNAKEADKILSAKSDNYLLKVQRRSASIIVLMDMSETPAPDSDPSDD